MAYIDERKLYAHLYECRMALLFKQTIAQPWLCNYCERMNTFFGCPVHTCLPMVTTYKEDSQNSVEFKYNCNRGAMPNGTLSIDVSRSECCGQFLFKCQAKKMCLSPEIKDFAMVKDEFMFAIFWAVTGLAAEPMTETLSGYMDAFVSDTSRKIVNTHSEVQSWDFTGCIDSNTFTSKGRLYKTVFPASMVHRPF